MILEIRLECLIWRLSRLVEVKREEVEDVFEICDDFFKADLRGLGALCVGAWGRCQLRLVTLGRWCSGRVLTMMGCFRPIGNSLRSVSPDV